MSGGPTHTNGALITRADGTPSGLQGIYAGRSCFLVCGGPSLKTISKRHRRILERPGMILAGLNNSPKIIRPQIWFCVDEPDHFIRSIFLDPKIMKFLPSGKVGKPVFNSDTWQPAGVTTEACPSTFYFRLTHDGYPDRYMSQETFFWGMQGKDGGGRSVMHVAPKLLHWLGFRRVFLIGADFRMSDKEKYAFSQNRTSGSIKGNNSTYEKLNERFAVLRPQIEACGLTIINCTPNSGLKAFDFMPLGKAIELAWAEFDVNLRRERTYGLYERNGIRKAIDNWNSKATTRTTEAKPMVDAAIRNPGDKKAAKAAKKAIDKAVNATRAAFDKEREYIELQFWKG